MKFDPNQLIQPACVLLGMLFALFVKDKARELAKDEFTHAISLALAEFKQDLLRELDGTYMRSAECRLQTEHQDDRIDIHESRISNLEDRIPNNHGRNKA